MVKREPAGDDLSRRERQIMEVVYRLGEASVADVRREMKEAPSRNTVRTLLGILETKGHLTHRVAGRSYVYKPKQRRTSAGRRAVSRVISTFFDGSLEKAVAVYLSGGEADVSEDELDRLENLIRETRKKGR